MTPTTLDQLPSLQTDRLHLRPLTLDDAAALQTVTDHAAITDFVHFLPQPFTVSDAEHLILGKQDGRDRFLGAWLRGTEELVAVVGTHLHGANEVEIGYWVRPSHHRQGVANEAVRAVLAGLCGTFPDRQVVAECRPENAASWHLLERLGFRPAGENGRRPGRQRLVLAQRDAARAAAV
jgi:[ribosomal protein S5]-alanine N-acetyltransferase